MILDDVMVLSVILVMISHPTSTLPRCCIIHVLPAFIAIIFVMSFDEELILPYYCNYQ